MIIGKNLIFYKTEHNFKIFKFYYKYNFKLVRLESVPYILHILQKICRNRFILATSVLYYCDGLNNFNLLKSLKILRTHKSRVVNPSLLSKSNLFIGLCACIIVDNARTFAFLQFEWANQVRLDLKKSPNQYTWKHSLKLSQIEMNQTDPTLCIEYYAKCWDTRDFAHCHTKNLCTRVFESNFCREPVNHGVVDLSKVTS